MSCPDYTFEVVYKCTGQANKAALQRKFCMDRQSIFEQHYRSKSEFTEHNRGSYTCRVLSWPKSTHLVVLVEFTS